ncbi:MAG: hypothetical protein JW825_04420 [Candidatus Methanofastidiosa archaeon]|nr:hypothetical protein [Candidatus Methanofastidiosa archaeon]
MHTIFERLMIMAHFTIGVLGQQDNDFLKRLGNKGTINDIEFRNFSTERDLFTYCSPKSDKVAPLMQIMGIIDFPVLVFDKPNSYLGEAVLAVDARKFENGIICVSEEFGEERARKLIEGSNLESYDLLPMDADSLKDHLASKEFQATIAAPAGPTKIPIDNYFVVKSVGTVILGVVKRGEIGVYTKLSIYPDDIDVLVKSIQCHDKDVRNATTLQRVGLSLKGVKVEDLKRGNVIAQKGSMMVSKSMRVGLERNKVLKGAISEGDSFFVSIGLQSPVGRIVSIDGDVLTIDLEREVAYDASDRAILALTTPKPPRIIGGGNIII